VITNGEEKDGRLSIRDDLAALKGDVPALAATVDRIDTVLVAVMGEQGAGHRREAVRRTVALRRAPGQAVGGGRATPSSPTAPA